MKLKTDFVTNSSSSSFIIAFDQKITFAYLKKNIMFLEKAHQVWTDCRRQTITKLTPENDELIEKIIREVVSGYYPGFHKYALSETDFLKEIDQYDREIRDNLWKPEHAELRDRYWHEASKRTNLGAIPCAMEFIKANMNKYIGFFSYGDGDGDFFSAMEHGGTFNSFNELTISHH